MRQVSPATAPHQEQEFTRLVLLRTWHNPVLGWFKVTGKIIDLSFPVGSRNTVVVLVTVRTRSAAFRTKRLQEGLNSFSVQNCSVFLSWESNSSAFRRLRKQMPGYFYPTRFHTLQQPLLLQQALENHWGLIPPNIFIFQS